MDERNRGIRRAKKDAGNTIPVPQTLQTMEIPEEYTVTHTDEPFLLYDSGIDSPARIQLVTTVPYTLYIYLPVNFIYKIFSGWVR
jgi:hypothetical protein